ncbi:hypothetical protein NKH77_29735 [Streptomyces sp. M19]
MERHDFDFLINHAHHEDWEEVIRMSVALARPDEAAYLLNGLLSPARRPPGPGPAAQAPRGRVPGARHGARPEVRARVHRYTRDLVRPTTLEGARALGWIGPIVLEMLPDPTDVDDQDAHRPPSPPPRSPTTGPSTTSSGCAAAPPGRCAPNSPGPGGGTTPTGTRTRSSPTSTSTGSTSPSPTSTNSAPCAASGSLPRADRRNVHPGPAHPGPRRVAAHRVVLAYDLGVTMEWLSAFPDCTLCG